MMSFAPQSMCWLQSKQTDIPTGERTMDEITGTETGTPAPPEQTQLSSEAQQMLAWIAEDAKAGKLSAEQAEVARREALGEDAPTTPAAPVNGDVQALTEIGFPPAREIDIKVPLVVGEDGRHDRKTEATIRTWAVASQMPAGIVNSVIGRADTYLQRVEGMNDGQRNLNQRSEMVKLERVFGADTKARIENARAVAREIDAAHPGFLHFLEESGLGDSHELIVQLANHGARLKDIRNGKR
jgi:hypothetical protein